MSDSFDTFNSSSSYVPPAAKRFGELAPVEPRPGDPTPQDIAEVVLPIVGAVVPAVGQVQRLVDAIAPHVESGNVTPEAAMLSLAQVLTRWIK